MASGSEQTLLILGATGDLAARLLLPGLGDLLTAGSEGVSLVGADLNDWDDGRWRARVAQSFGMADASGTRVDEVAKSTRYVRADITRKGEWRRLLEACEGSVVIYFALPPAITERVCQALAGVTLPGGARLVFEKPFGRDVASAEALNRRVTQLVPEERVYRVDHFLGMSTVLNIAGVRFANRMVEPLLSAEHVQTVDIVFDEAIGLEGRARYYDGAGALVDMIQSHLLQVLSLVAMEPPETISERDVRDAKAAVLRATHVWNDDPVASSRRARYTTGKVDGRRLPSYVNEEGIPGESTTETLAEVVCEVDAPRWKGVPFRLRSGKALGNPRQEVLITFRAATHVPKGLTGEERPNRLRIGIALETGRMGLELNVNGPGDPRVLDGVTLGADLGPGELHAYGGVLTTIFAGNPILSVRGDMAVDSWRIIEPVLEAWQTDDVPLQEYPAGSTGPDDWRNY